MGFAFRGLELHKSISLIGTRVSPEEAHTSIYQESLRPRSTSQERNGLVSSVVLRVMAQFLRVCTCVVSDGSHFGAPRS